MSPSPVHARQSTSLNHGLIAEMLSIDTTQLAEAAAAQSVTSLGTDRNGAGDGSILLESRRAVTDFADRCCPCSPKDGMADVGDERGDEMSDYKRPIVGRDVQHVAAEIEIAADGRNRQRARQRGSAKQDR